MAIVKIILKHFFVVLLLMVGALAVAQDLHYSLPFRTPLLLNPALTGEAESHYRVVSAYKSQWSAIETPYRTIYTSYDMRLVQEEDKDKYMAVGLALYNDKAGKTKMGLNQLNLSVASGVRLNILHFFTGGIQMGFAQRSAVYDGIKWDNQYNGAGYDPSLPSGETNLPENYSYLDLGAGVSWRYTPLNYYSLKFGYSISHFNKAKSTYFDDGTDKQNIRMIFHINGDWEVNKQFSLLPKLFVVKKGSSIEFNGGGFVQYITGESSKYTNFITASTVSIGCFYRYNDAVIASVLYDYKRILSIAASYDFNISSLRVASSARGGVEISLIYKGFFDQQRIKL